MAASTERYLPSGITPKSLGISTDKPKFPQYAFLHKRLETFKELPWPKNCPVSVQDLAEAGLVNTGVLTVLQSDRSINRVDTYQENFSMVSRFETVKVQNYTFGELFSQCIICCFTMQ